MSCQNCYEVRIPECPSSLTVLAQLDVNSDFVVTITDKFNKRFTQEVTTDSNGSFEIDLTDIPAGTFNRHAGNFRIEVFLAENNTCDPELLQFCCDGVVKDFHCVVMSFFQSDLGSLETEIGCPCP